MSYEIRDRSGRKVGRLETSSGCHPIFALLLIIIPAAVIIGLLWAIIGVIGGIGNLMQHHPWNWNPTDATATAITSYHYETTVFSAIRNGKTSLKTDSSTNELEVELRLGGSITFDKVAVTDAGSYYLCIDGSDGTNEVIVSINVNGNFAKKIDTERNVFGGSSSPNSCVSDIIIQLQNGINSIQLIVDKNNKCFANGDCPSILVKGISIDRKFT